MKPCWILLFPLLSGCLSMFPGTLSQTLEMKQQPDGIRVEVLADGKRVAETVTPGEVKLRRGAGYVFRFTKPGYRTKIVQTWTVSASGGRIFGSCLLGIPTLELGMVADMLAGALHSIDDTALSVTLEPLNPAERRLHLQVQADDQNGSPLMSFRQVARPDGP